MAVESAGCPYVKVPVPIQDTYSVAEIAILLRVSRNAVYDGVSLERPPAAQEDDGEEEGPLRVQGRAARVEQAPRDVRALFSVLARRAFRRYLSVSRDCQLIFGCATIRAIYLFEKKKDIDKS